jgi:hypothetical protein
VPLSCSLGEREDQYLDYGGLLNIGTILFGSCDLTKALDLNLHPKTRFDPELPLVPEQIVFRNKRFIPDKLVLPEWGNHSGMCQLFRKKSCSGMSLFSDHHCDH